MRVLILCGLMLFTFMSKAQKEVVEGRIVLLTDSVNIFGKKHISTEFTHGYYLVEMEMNKPFTNSEYDLFIKKVSNFHTDITSFKSVENKNMICIFPKHASKRIESFLEFIKINFPEILISTSKIKYIQVVQSYDPNNKQEEKGFN